jgi:ankyrin repeat protein
MYAADRGNLHFAEALLKSGADKTLKNADGKTALEIAQQRAASAGTDDPANAIVTLLRQ